MSKTKKAKTEKLFTFNDTTTDVCNSIENYTIIWNELTSRLRNMLNNKETSFLIPTKELYELPFKQKDFYMDDLQACLRAFEEFMRCKHFIFEAEKNFFKGIGYTFNNITFEDDKIKRISP